MATAPANQNEVLLKRPIPLRKRLWVRVALVLLLIGIIGLATCWWPRRGIIATWRANGNVACDSMHAVTTTLLGRIDPRGTGWARQVTYFWRLISWAGVDDDVTWADLRNSSVDDQWLGHLQRFPKLFLLGLNDRQLGPGLEAVRNVRSLESVIVKSASQRRLMELRRIPQVNTVSLRELSAGDVGLEVLALLPGLKELSFVSCVQNDSFLTDLPEIPSLETLRIHWCRSFQEDDLASLRRVPNLKMLIIEGSTPVGDKGLAFISELKSLETFILRASAGDLTDEGLKVLQKLENLKEIIVTKGDLPAAQIKTLRDLLPNVIIRD